MKRKAFIRYVNENPELRQWLINNRDWIEENPQAMKMIVHRWHRMSKRKTREKKGRRNGLPSFKIGKAPKMDLGKISEATEQLARTLDMLENVRNLMGVFNLR